MRHMGSVLTQTYNTTQGDQNVQHEIKHKSTTVSKDCVFNPYVQEDSLDTSTMGSVLLEIAHMEGAFSCHAGTD